MGVKQPTKQNSPKPAPPPPPPPKSAAAEAAAERKAETGPPTRNRDRMDRNLTTR